ncbi:hypothetical protein PoB_000837200 [Plakobranchus ocellatus]|uniref:Uncharacterized protein n=1 Tax=Plakobranchus ocellatus TaxID=259542 RepID=A0AAV3YHH1_9GAST|nr:hypothetical protein PoB_000837200 [Plakobranchus ocellatus]
MTTQQGSNAAALPVNFYRNYRTIHGEIKLIYFKVCLSNFGITKSRLERIQRNLTPTGMDHWTEEENTKTDPRLLSVTEV